MKLQNLLLGNNVLPSFILPQSHMSNYSCSLVLSNATLQNEGSFFLCHDLTSGYALIRVIL